MNGSLRKRPERACPSPSAACPHPFCTLPGAPSLLLLRRPPLTPRTAAPAAGASRLFCAVVRSASASARQALVCCAPALASGTWSIVIQQIASVCCVPGIRLGSRKRAVPRE